MHLESEQQELALSDTSGVADDKWALVEWLNGFFLFLLAKIFHKMHSYHEVTSLYMSVSILTTLGWLIESNAVT